MEQRQFPAITHQSLTRTCQEAGIRATPQRLAVYKAVLDHGGHPTPAQVHTYVCRELPTVALATVYKALDVLHRHGLLSRVATEGEAVRYDANLAPHHHLVCMRCGALTDVAAKEVAVQGAGDGAGDGFAVQRVAVFAYGVCPACARAEAAVSDTP